MYGYVYMSTNSSTGMKYIGINRAVKFNKEVVGDTEAILKDISTYGKHNFHVEMLMPYEDEHTLEFGLNAFIKKYDALNDPSFYNCEKPKRSRKKRSEDESLSAVVE